MAQKGQKYSENGLMMQNSIDYLKGSLPISQRWWASHAPDQPENYAQFAEIDRVIRALDVVQNIVVFDVMVCIQTRVA